MLVEFRFVATEPTEPPRASRIVRFMVVGIWTLAKDSCVISCVLRKSRARLGSRLVKWCTTSQIAAPCAARQPTNEGNGRGHRQYPQHYCRTGLADSPVTRCRLCLPSFRGKGWFVEIRRACRRWESAEPTGFLRVGGCRAPLPCRACADCGRSRLLASCLLLPANPVHKAASSRLRSSEKTEKVSPRD